MGRKRLSGWLVTTLLVLAAGCGEPEPVPTGQNPFSGSPGAPGSVQPPRAVSSGRLARGAPPPVAVRSASGTRRPSGTAGTGNVATNGTGGDGASSSDANGADQPPQFPEEDRAIAEATRLIDENPFTTHVAYNNRAVAYYAKGELERALADLNRAIEIKPDYAEALHNRGVVHEALGEQAKAKADFAEASRLGQ